MERKIKEFSNGTYLSFDTGYFDDWCVYLTNRNGRRYSPKDSDYFTILKEYANKYGYKRISGDFIQIYNLTGKVAELSVLQKISMIAYTYQEDSELLDIIFSILYMGMIAEENKKGTHLGKRIKRLGIYTLLIEQKKVDYAANFMRHMGWREIDSLCRERGF